MQHQDKKIKQHYVPQSYLKRFTHNGKLLFVFDKFTKEVRPANTRDVAQERYFYDIPPDFISPDVPDINRDPHLEEKALGALEGSFTESYDAMLGIAEGRRAHIDDKQKMALYLAIQVLRTRATRDDLTEAYERGKEAILDNVLRMVRPDLATELKVKVEKHTKSQAALLHANFMWDTEIVSNLAVVLFRHIWLVGVNKTEQPLFTSDHPVVRYAHMETPSLLDTRSPSEDTEVMIEIGSNLPGLASEGVEIVFPLTPDRALILLERTYFNHCEKGDGQTYPLDAEYVERYNRLQVEQSHRQVFCSTSDFDLAAKMCEENPQLSSPDRSDVSIRVQDNL